MGYSYKCYSDTKDFMKKYVNAEEGAVILGFMHRQLIFLILQHSLNGLNHVI